MTFRRVAAALAGAALLTSAACGSQVSYLGSGSTSGAGGTTSSVTTDSSSSVLDTSADGAPYCFGDPTCFDCATSAPVGATCMSDTWVCPAGAAHSVDQCPCNLGPPLSCDGKLGAKGCAYSCALGEGCVHAGPTPVCTSCPDKAIHQVGPYACACDAFGHMECKLIGGCCTGKDPQECGDALAMSCIANVCVPPPPPGHCWQDADCPPGQICTGDTLCPCGSQCKTGNKPGTCVKK